MCPEPQLLPEAEPAVIAFTVVQTQWRVGMAGRTGLDYTAAWNTLERYLPRWQALMPDTFAELELTELMEHVQTIENAMLVADGERRDREDQVKGLH